MYVLHEETEIQLHIKGEISFPIFSQSEPTGMCTRSH